MQRGPVSVHAGVSNSEEPVHHRVRARRHLLPRHLAQLPEAYHGLQGPKVDRYKLCVDHVHPRRARYGASAVVPPRAAPILLVQIVQNRTFLPFDLSIVIRTQLCPVEVFEEETE